MDVLAVIILILIIAAVLGAFTVSPLLLVVGLVIALILFLFRGHSSGKYFS